MQEQQGAAQIRLFDSAFMEWFTRISPRTIALFWGPIVAALTIAGLFAVHRTPLQLLETVVGVLLLWTFFEYFFHRVLFHLMGALPWGERFAFIMHGCHHADPADATRNVLPLVVTIPLGIAISAASLLFFRPADFLFPLGIFGVGYLSYDLLHYAFHQVNLPWRLGRYLKRHHLLHHHRDSGTNFAVTFPLWDKVFGTYG
jgi:sterol desaturase/sphingolipid hydroxylase (fatty acid hydroxylase superfamily)